MLNITHLLSPPLVEEVQEEEDRVSCPEHDIISSVKPIYTAVQHKETLPLTQGMLLITNTPLGHAVTVSAV